MQFAEYACIENCKDQPLHAVNPLSRDKQLTPLPPLPESSHVYSEVNMLSSEPHANEHYEFIDHLPSAGTTL